MSLVQGDSTAFNSAINVSVLQRTAGTQYFTVVPVSHLAIPMCVAESFYRKDSD